MSLADRLKQDSKEALRAGDKARLGTLRMALAAIKQREVDTRESLGDDDVLRVIEKLIKQGRDAAQQFAAAGRDELAAKESAEIAVLEGYLPEPMSESDLDALIAEVIADTGATGPGDMGRVMGAIKQRATGRVDMGAVNVRVRAALTR